MKFIILLFLLPLQIFAQDLSGVWVGRIATSGTEIPLELVVSQDLTGYMMMTSTYKGTEIIAVRKMNLIENNGTYTISDGKMVYDNFKTKSRNVKTYCEFSLKMVNDEMVLSGDFHTRSRDLRAGDEDLDKGTITLQKEKTIARTKLISKLDSLKLMNTVSFSIPAPGAKQDLIAIAAPEKSLPISKAIDTTTSATVQNTNTKTADQEVVITEAPDKDVAKASVQQQIISKQQEKKNYSIASNTVASTASIAVDKRLLGAADVALRKTEVIRSIDFKADSLTLTLYDNGTVDGDTVSVVLNGEVVIPRQGLSEAAYRKVIYVPRELGDSLLLIMYAENLGSIPPNTGLLIVDDGTDRQEIRFEGDLKKSSAVVLRRRK